MTSRGNHFPENKLTQSSCSLKIIKANQEWTVPFKYYSFAKPLVQLNSPLPPKKNRPWRIGAIGR